jgi:hypothetical protein
VYVDIPQKQTVTTPEVSVDICNRNRVLTAPEMYADIPQKQTAAAPEVYVDICHRNKP